ncbi:hypothetical protein [Pedomonas sp. V897]|uniref:hypothetical protein n=1 Tax=Pedomonas sp. V897 TaxID=3446482 RepID=UPI003EE034E0
MTATATTARPHDPATETDAVVNGGWFTLWVAITLVSVPSWIGGGALFALAETPFVRLVGQVRAAA